MKVERLHALETHQGGRVADALTDEAQVCDLVMHVNFGFEDRVQSP